MSWYTLMQSLWCTMKGSLCMYYSTINGIINQMQYIVLVFKWPHNVIWMISLLIHIIKSVYFIIDLSINNLEFGSILMKFSQNCIQIIDCEFIQIHQQKHHCTHFNRQNIIINLY